MNPRKLSISIDYSKCSSCSKLVCVGVCPQAVLEVNSNKKPEIVDEASCTYCEVCINLCPSKAISFKTSSSSDEL